MTGRARILKFDGCYHGHSDGLLVGAGSGVATLGIPGSPGVPKAMTDLTIIAPFNDLEATRKAFRRWGKDIAAIIVEPIAGNMGCIPPVPGFLEGLRSLCDEHGAFYISDEVICAFGRLGHMFGADRFGDGGSMRASGDRRHPELARARARFALDGGAGRRS